MAADSRHRSTLFRTTVAAITCVLLALILLGGPLSGTPAGISPYIANIIGQIAAYAILALALDLIWGYAGILSLGHGLFFAIGGYLMAMHLLKSGFVFGGVKPDILIFMGWQDFPLWWSGLQFFPWALLMILLIPGVVALVYGFFAFNSRVNGVYFAIITQALTYVAMLLMFRNDTGFGGNNGMTGFTEVLGQSISADSTVLGMAVVSVALLLAALLMCRLFTRSAFGNLLVAVRDDEERLRFLGYNTITPKLVVWCLSAILASIAGALYVPQVGIVNPRILSPELSIEIAVWVALGGRGALSGAVIGATLLSGLKFLLTGLVPDLWPFILSMIVLLVVVGLKNGLIDLRWPGRKTVPLAIAMPEPPARLEPDTP